MESSIEIIFNKSSKFAKNIVLRFKVIVFNIFNDTKIIFLLEITLERKKIESFKQ